MKIRTPNEATEHVITLIEESSLYTVMISRLNPPLFAIAYDHLSKSGTLIENERTPADVKLILAKAVRFGLHDVE